MADWRTELQRVLAALSDDANNGAIALLSRASDRLDEREALQFITEAFPEYISTYISAGADIGTTLYEDLPGGVDGFNGVTPPLPPVEQLAANGRFALLSNSATAVQGVVTRLVNGGVRDAQFANLAAEYGDPAILENPAASLGTFWARHASANACGFCRMLATRGAVFRSKASAITVVGRSVELTAADRRMVAAGQSTKAELLDRHGSAVRPTRGTQKLGGKFHDHCHCIAVPVRPGSSYQPAPYVEQWQKDYDQARKDGAQTPAQIAAAMDNSPGGTGPQRRQESAAKRSQKRHDERRQGQPGGPGGSPPNTVPPRGGKGYSDDDDERRLEWELDDAMRRRMKSADGSIDEVLARINALQQYRAANGITGRLDERFGKPFDTDERVVVDKLLAEGHNVTSIAVLRTGDTTPDMAVDARLAEIKTSISSNVSNFGKRVADAYEEQGAPAVFVNATGSRIARADMERVMQDIVSRGDSLYIRVIGSDYDSEFGRW